MRLSVVAAVSFALAATATLHAQSGKTWDKAYPVNGRASLEVTTGEAGLRVTGCGTCTSVSIHVDARDQDLKDYVLEQNSSGNRITFALKRRNEMGWGWTKGRSPEVTIQTPMLSDVAIKSGSGGTDVAGINGAIQITAGSGGVHIAESGGQLVGTIGSGGFSADGGFSRFQVRAGSGSVSMRLRPGQQIDGDSSVTAGSGSVHLTVPRDLHAAVQASTGSGSFHSDLPLLTNDMGNRHSVTGTLNGGGPQLRINTGSGSAHIDSL